MLCAKIVSTNESAVAKFATKATGPFLCPECENEVVLRMGSVRLNHFAHKRSSHCEYGRGETDAHRRCKMAIYEALLKEPNVKNAALERSLKTCRPDVSAYINGVLVAIEVQISTLTMETIIRRTTEYARKGIYVLWLLQWTPYLDGTRYSPRLWEKWIHATYFGRVYYWIEGLKIVSYHFDPYLKHVPKEPMVWERRRRNERWRFQQKIETTPLACSRRSPQIGEGFCRDAARSVGNKWFKNSPRKTFYGASFWGAQPDS